MARSQFFCDWLKGLSSWSGIATNRASPKLSTTALTWHICFITQAIAASSRSNDRAAPAAGWSTSRKCCRSKRQRNRHCQNGSGLFTLASTARRRSVDTQAASLEQAGLPRPRCPDRSCGRQALGGASRQSAAGAARRRRCKRVVRGSRADRAYRPPGS